MKIHTTPEEKQALVEKFRAAGAKAATRKNDGCPTEVRPVISLVLITEHAYDRAKERFGWKSKVLDKMAEKAFLEGIKHKNTKGSLMRYLTKLWFKYKHCNNVRIYGENIFFFCDNRLITVYQLPNDLRKHVKYCQ